MSLESEKVSFISLIHQGVDAFACSMNDIEERVSLICGKHRGILSYIELADFYEFSKGDFFKAHYKSILAKFGIEDIRILFSRAFSLFRDTDFASEEHRQKMNLLITYMQEAFGLSLKAIFQDFPFLVFETDTFREDFDFLNRYQHYNDVQTTLKYFASRELGNTGDINYFSPEDQVISMGQCFCIVRDTKGKPFIASEPYMVRLNYSKRLKGITGEARDIKTEYMLLGLIEQVLNIYIQYEKTIEDISASAKDNPQIQDYITQVYDLNVQALENLRAFLNFLGNTYQFSSLVQRAFEKLQYHEKSHMISQYVEDLLSAKPSPERDIGRPTILGPRQPVLVVSNT